MFQFSASAILDRRHDSVWRWLIDFPSVPRWEGGVREVRQVSPGSAGLGSEFLIRREYGGREAVVHGRITEWQDGRSATMRIEGGPLQEAFATYAAEALDDGRTRVTYTTHGTLRGQWRLLTPLVSAMGRRQIAKNLVNLERLIEGPSNRADPAE